MVAFTNENTDAYSDEVASDWQYFKHVILI